jgi:uncharacterized membrane protein YeaQ/YmgE (transglycosylase-associated protein family)
LQLLVFTGFGLIVGVLARALVTGRAAGGWVAWMLIGISGAFVGGLLGRLFRMYDDGCPAGWLMSVLGAVAFVLSQHPSRGAEHRAASASWKPVVFGGRSESSVGRRNTP